MRRTTQRIGIGATFLLTACLAQAVAFVPPWCHTQGTQNTDLSSDEKWILSADASTHSLTLFNNALETVQRYRATTLDGILRSRIGGVYDAPLRRSFIVTLPDIAELWEISYDPNSEPIYDGLVHDYRMGEGIAKSGYLGVRRTRLTTPMVDLYFTQDSHSVIGVTNASVIAAGEVAYAHVINLDIRREIATIALVVPTVPEADLIVTGSGTSWRAAPGARLKAVKSALLGRYCTP